MFASTLAEAFEAATPEACRALIAQGVTFTVAVENERGEWFLCHADDKAHAALLAANWVGILKARGASTWRLTDTGVARRSSMVVTEPIEWPAE